MASCVICCLLSLGGCVCVWVPRVICLSAHPHSLIEPCVGFPGATGPPAATGHCITTVTVTMSSVRRSASLIGRLVPSRSYLFVCDIQERFRSSIKFFDEIILTSSRLIHASQIMQIPIIVTEQYPKGLFYLQLTSLGYKLIDQKQD